jgi:hypothetical protein
MGMVRLSGKGIRNLAGAVVLRLLVRVANREPCEHMLDV